ncbi:hypothetical protein [Paucisalibacillus sp. EB02]|uniref:hypothetical protein n=1 Tax=Paucisalibacillus sp. EB02 TaxID=1347087 RepID=UPI001E658073|nr:hypothetical protein [Paucisalibacillus sp. EB02]
MGNEQRNLRIEKLKALSSQGISGYPDRFSTNYELNEVAQLADETTGVRVAGRIMSVGSFKN